jgi:hypothetical protein
LDCLQSQNADAYIPRDIRLRDDAQAVFGANPTTTELQPMISVRFAKLWILWSGFPTPKYSFMLSRYTGEMQNFAEKNGQPDYRYTSQCDWTAAHAVGVAKRKF